jgi:general secretion pathway protein G
LCYNNSKIIEGKYKMLKTDRKAFTVIELVMVIVVIGVLSAVALPRFSGTAESAYLSKAESEVVAIRNALATERQRRILKGDFATSITDLASTDPTNNVFDTFSADSSGRTVSIFSYPIPKCASGARACWVRTDATHYSYRFVDSSDGKADFILSNNKFDCTTSDTTDCQKIIR